MQTLFPTPIGTGPLETAVLEVLWAADHPLTVRAMHTALRDQGDRAYTTIMTTAVRMVEKGLLVRESGRRGFGGSYRYRAVVSKAALLAQEIEALCARLGVDSADRAAALALLAAR